MQAWMLLHFIKRYKGKARYVVLFVITFSIFQLWEKTV